MYPKIRFDKKTGKYVINSLEIAEVTNTMVTDVEYKILKMSARLEEVGKLSCIVGSYGTKRHNLNSVQFHLFITEYPYLKNDTTTLIQQTLLAATLDDKDLAEDLAERITYGIKED